MAAEEKNTNRGFITDAPALGLTETEVIHREKLWEKIVKILLVILIYLGSIPFMLIMVPKIAELFIPVNALFWHSKAEPDETRIQALTRDISNLEKKVARFTPGNVYLVVNTTENHFTLYKNRKPVLEGICSTGKQVSLEGENNKKWVFKTPRGEFKVLTKLTKPIWRKPDWAFVEEGLPIPSANHPSRYEKGTLGDYALVIGNGYMIHGTLYQRFLGLPVTHGCIRVGDADLKIVYETLPVGSKIFIY